MYYNRLFPHSYSKGWTFILSRETRILLSWSPEEGRVEPMKTVYINTYVSWHERITNLICCCIGRGFSQWWVKNVRKENRDWYERNDTIVLSLLHVFSYLVLQLEHCDAHQTSLPCKVQHQRHSLHLVLQPLLV